MDFSEEKILSVIRRKLPDFEIRGTLQPLEGGNLNHVWRLEGSTGNLIVKFAPPYIVSNPEVPLNPERIQFEADALQLFRQGEILHFLSSSEIRPPQFVFYDPKNHLLAMEDVGDLPHIGQPNLHTLDYPDPGTTLGNFIGRLHKLTYQNDDLAARFNNNDIQKKRFEMQYLPAADYAEKGGGREISAIKKRTKMLGRNLLQPGLCLVMGDLWPPSILIDGDTLRLIDWEFCHYGRPLQDVGHFAAHCWMLAHAASPPKEKLFKALWLSFWEAYENELGDIFSHLIDERELNDAATHIGAEILVRAAGLFKGGYVYQSHEAGSSLIDEAVQKAQQLILANDFSSMWV